MNLRSAVPIELSMSGVHGSSGYACRTPRGLIRHDIGGAHGGEVDLLFVDVSQQPGTQSAADLARGVHSMLQDLFRSDFHKRWLVQLRVRPMPACTCRGASRPLILLLLS